MTNEGVVILTSCAHRGLMNTVRYVLNLFPIVPLYGIIGGFHIFDNYKETNEIIEQLKPLNPKLLAPCHCTGLASSSIFQGSFPKAYYPFTTGDTITL